MSSKLFASAEEIASRRILRLALGVTVALIFSQAINWPMSFIIPVFTMLILGLPIPSPGLKGGVIFVLALIVPLSLATLILVPLFEHARWAGILILILALFGCFYYSARGGSMILGTFMTIGLTVVITVGSVDIDALLAMTSILMVCAIFGIIFVWLAHALLPELAMEPSQAAAQKKELPSRQVARRGALRSLVIVLPMTIFFLFSGSSASYIPIMLKVVAMGQQANTDVSRKMGREQIESTLWGGLAAMIAWQIMSIWPSLLMYGLLVALSALLFGPRIFVGKGMHQKSGMWFYAFLTMIIILAPALLDGQSSNGADAAFYTRLLLFIVIAFYGSLSVIVFDAFWPAKEERPI